MLPCSKGTIYMVELAFTYVVQQLKLCFLFDSIVGTDVDDILEELVGGTDIVATHGEELIATIESIVIKLEAVIGNRTVPTLALEAGMNARVKDWSTQVRAMKYQGMGGEGRGGEGAMTSK